MDGLSVPSLAQECNSWASKGSSPSFCPLPTASRHNPDDVTGASKTVTYIVHPGD